MAGGFDDAVTTEVQPGRTITKILTRPAGVRCFFKIDYYNRKTEFGSPDPAITTRVLTIILADRFE